MKAAHMATTAFFLAAALLPYASAQNVTTAVLLPDELWWMPTYETFVGQSTVAADTTYYTLDCGPDNDGNGFWPWSGGTRCGDDNSYTFSAHAATTRFLMRG